MKIKAPTDALTLTGAENYTAEAMQVSFNPSMRFQAVELKEKFHDLPYLPNRM